MKRKQPNRQVAASDWRIVRGSGGVSHITDASGKLLLTGFWWQDCSTTTANRLTERVVACMNACVGLTNEQLQRAVSLIAVLTRACDLAQDAQGEWVAVDASHAPEWTLALKEIAADIDAVLES